ncbi:MAG: hypothetical protein AAFS07_07230 [Pseudomonadota bacterium]
MVDSIGNPIGGLPPNGGVQNTSDPEKAIAPTQMSTREQSIENFEQMINQSTITQLDQQQFTAEVDVANDISKTSVGIDLGQNTPL